ncbi:MAG: hypothetical protein ACRDS9_20790 [Pseudonocardiaceae bacterium]
MTPQLAGAVLCILEIVSLDMQRTPAQLRTQLESLELPVRVIGELNGYPGILVETEDSTATKLREQFVVADAPIEIVELRRHFHPPTLSSDHLMALIAVCHRDRRLAVGAGAAERAVQRRRLELLVLANDLAESYARMIEAVIEGTGYQGTVIVADLTREELGRAAGVRRAGCVGVLRGSRHVAL